MANKKKRMPEDESKKDLKYNIEMIKTLLILLVNKLGVEKIDIAKSMGISKGELSKMLNPKKYKRR